MRRFIVNGGRSKVTVEEERNIGEAVYSRLYMVTPPVLRLMATFSQI